MTTWDAMSSKDKIGLIIEKVMGWQCFDDYYAYSQAVYYSPEAHEPRVYPVAHWCKNNIDFDDTWIVFHDKDETYEPFDPLNDMSDAWLILQKFATLYSEVQSKSNDMWNRGVACNWDQEALNNDLERTEYSKLSQIEYAFTSGLKMDEVNAGDLRQSLYEDVAEWTPEIICKAALKAYGLLEAERE